MRSWLRVGSVFLILGTLLLVSRLWSDTKQPAAPRSRIALVNLAYLIKHSEKAKAFQEALKEESKSSEKRAKELQEPIDKLNKELTDKPDLAVDKREEIEQRLKKLNRELEDFLDEARKNWSKKNDKAMITIHKELQYNDAAEEADLNSPTSISRKLQAVGCLPLYAAPGMDISKEILTALNDNKPRGSKGGD